MKIAFLRYPVELYRLGRVNKGGSEVVNQQIVEYLRSCGEEVIEFSPAHPDRINLIDIAGLGTPLMFQELLREVDEINQCDIMVSTNWFGAILPEVKIPYVTIFHSCARWVSDAVQNVAQHERANADKWVERAKSYGLSQNKKDDLHERVIAVEEEYLAKHSNFIIAVSASLLNALREYYDFNRDKAVVIHNPFSSQWKQIKVQKDFTNTMKLICVTRMGGTRDSFIGKGGDRLAEILSHFREQPKEIVFSTELLSYKSFIDDYVGNANFHASIEHKKVGELLARSHISLHCSRCEACQMTLIESMYMSNVPVSFRAGIADQLIINGKNGFIVDSVREAKAVISKLYNNPKRAARIASLARKTIVERLSIDTIGPQYIKVLKRIAQHGKST